MRQTTTLGLALGLVLLGLGSGCGRKIDGRTLGQWKKDLKSESEAERAAAVATLGKLGPEAVPALIDALGDKEALARRNAAKGLEQVGAGAKDAVPALLRALSDGDYDVRQNATAALAAIGPASVPALVGGLKDADPNVRKNAAAALGPIGAQAGDAVGALREALKDADYSVRKNALAALARIRPDPQDVLPLLRDENTFVRQQAAEILASLGPSNAPALSQVLGDQDETVRTAAKAALETVGASAVPTLIEALKSKDPGARATAAQVLQRMGAGAAPAAAALGEALRDEAQPVRREALRALMAMGPAAKEAAAALGETLNDGDESIRRDALALLGTLGPHAKAALPGMSRALAERRSMDRRQLIKTMIKVGPTEDVAIRALVAALGDDQAQELVCKALGKAGLPALPALLEALNGKDKRVAGNAARAIGQLGSPARDAVPHLVRRAATAPDPYILERSRQAVRQILGEREAAELLLGMMKAEDDLILCRGAMLLLEPEAPGLAQAVPALVPMLGDENQIARQCACELLGRIGKPAVPALVEALEGGDERLGGNAAAALGHMGPKAQDAVPALNQAEPRWTGWARKNVQAALARIAGEKAPDLSAH